MSQAPPSSLDEALISTLVAALDRLESDRSLLEETRFGDRARALDLLEFHVLDRLRAWADVWMAPESARGDPGEPDLLRAMRSRAEGLRDRLEEIDRRLFEGLRAEIRSGLRGEALRSTIHRYVGEPIPGEARAGYDDLDDFLAGLLLIPPVPEASRGLEPGMVFYQPTPARVILELADRVQAARGQLVIDIGSGLGLVPILIHLLTGIRTAGIEIDPAYHRYAVDRAHDLGIGESVDFREGDARASDYREADVLFLYTPFLWNMLDDVLERLRGQCAGRKVRLFSYGPCTATLARRGWLEAAGAVDGAELLACFITLSWPLSKSEPMFERMRDPASDLPDRRAGFD